MREHVQDIPRRRHPALLKKVGLNRSYATKCSSGDNNIVSLLERSDNAFTMCGMMIGLRLHPHICSALRTLANCIKTCEFLPHMDCENISEGECSGSKRYLKQKNKTFKLQLYLGSFFV